MSEVRIDDIKTISGSAGGETRRASVALLVTGTADTVEDVRAAVHRAVNDRKTPATGTMIEAARNLYANDECEIDDDACISDARPEGLWVSAWVWVANDDLNEADREDA